MDVLDVVDWIKPNHTYRLTNAITAFAISSGEHSAERCGLVCELPAGAEIKICGNGFNERTVTASYSGHHYYVFCRDLAFARVAAESVILEEEFPQVFSYEIQGS